MNELSIPHVTLLDYDFRRGGGGWGRIKYAIKQLISIGEDKNELLSTTKGILSDEKFEKMHKWKENPDSELGWINFLKIIMYIFPIPMI